MLRNWKEGRKEGVVSPRRSILISPFLVRLWPGEEVGALSLSPFACHPPHACKDPSSYLLAQFLVWSLNLFLLEQYSFKKIASYYKYRREGRSFWLNCTRDNCMSIYSGVSQAAWGQWPAARGGLGKQEPLCLTWRQPEQQVWPQAFAFHHKYLKFLAGFSRACFA